ncbi:pheromone A receptor-domain-containing protein [Mycena latifolia]|nr:pheromone A receptor-domain-containing protein [Mycena latifolia]
MAAYFYAGPPNWLFSVFAFVGFLCSTIPLPWHLEAWNTGTCLYMLWTGFACLIFFVDSIVWSNNMIDWSPAWCDFSTHFLNGFNLAIPACSLCINRRLYQIASVRSVTKTRAEKHRAIMIDLAIGLGLPILQIPLQYIVQGHRYNIFEDIGCLGETYETPVAIVLFHLPPILVGLVSAVYCVLSIKAFYHSRAQFKEFLSSNNNLNVNRYVRLMCLASTDLFLTIPISIFVLYANVAIVGISPWVSWADTHSNFSRVVQVPAFVWRADSWTVASLETTRWATVTCAFLFFGYFGFADEALKNYRGAFWSVAKRVGYSQATTSSGMLSSNGRSSKYNAKNAGLGSTLPVFIRKETSQKRDARSRASFDSDTSFSDVSASFAGLSYVDGEKSFGGDSSFDKDKSFGALSLNDVGGLLPTLPMHAVHAVPPEYSSPTSLSPPSSFPSSDASSSSASSDAGGPSRPQTPVEADADEIEVSSLHRASVYHAPIPPAPAPAHVRDAADAV